MTIKKTALLAAMLGLMSAPALAADNAFAGPYVGASLGVFQGKTTATEYSGFWDYGEYSISGGLDLSYAVQAGYNFTVGNSGVLGVELEYAAPQFDESQSFSTTYKNSGELNSIISLRAKAGLAVDKTLLYVTGGIAQVDADFYFGDTANANHTSASDTLNGLTVGAGAEMALSDNASVKVEYTTTKAESLNVPDMSGEPGAFHISGNSFTVGYNYHF